MRRNGAARCARALAPWPVLLILLVAYSCHHYVAAESSAYDTVRLEAIVAAWIAAGPGTRAPAVSIAVGTNGKLIFARGYGEARPGFPATDRTIYHIGSLTKQFTAATLLRLMQRGAKAPLSGKPLTVSTSVDEILRGFEGWNKHRRAPVTLRGLLTMTSGVPSLIGRPPPSANPWGTITSTLMLAHLRTLPLSGHGHVNAFSYSNSGYFLLTQLAEAIAAAEGEPRPFSHIVRSEVLSPALLEDTGFVREYTGTQLAVPSWGETPSYLRRPAFAEADWLKGAADMVSSATDLFAWNKALFENAILDEANTKLMFSPAARVSPARYYGMGWFIEYRADAEWLSHSGHVPGYTCLNSIVRYGHARDWISVSILTNRENVRGLDKLTIELVQALRPGL